LHPMSWPNYHAYTSLGGLHIGLAPLLPGRFNAGRSSTKFFDFVRCGAVGIYSDTAPYAGFVRNGVDGLLVRNDPDAWVEAISTLARDGETRSRMAQTAAQRLGAS
ncbi:MAG: glycosyl transferase group 1 family protein, partial [Thiotrichales bacterium SG8_50]